MLNPNNIKGKTFDTEKNGYSKEDVKEFLEQVAEDYAEVVKANQDTEAKIIKLVEKINEYREDEEAIQQCNCGDRKILTFCLAIFRIDAQHTPCSVFISSPKPIILIFHRRHEFFAQQTLPFIEKLRKLCYILFISRHYPIGHSV